MSELLCAFITVFIVVLVVRAVLSWFPLEQGGVLAQLSRVVADVTDWVVVPLRRVIPPVGMFDVSFLVLVFGLFLLRRVVC